MPVALLAEPRWTAAAQALVDGCLDLPHDEDRVALLVRVCDALGDQLYPAFLRVLTLIGQHGDHAARAAVARALVHALRTGRLPSGRRGAWGASAGLATSGGGYGRTRSLGPIEYLCAWHTHGDASQALPADQFCPAAAAVMDLVGASPEARGLYCEKLLADVDDPLGPISGALTRQARHALRALATAWAEGAPSLDAATRFVAALADAAPHSLAELAAQAAPVAR
jgi:hypothetical protein